MGMKRREFIQSISTGIMAGAFGGWISTKIFKSPDTKFDDCYSGVPGGSAPQVDFTARYRFDWIPEFNVSDIVTTNIEWNDQGIDTYIVIESNPESGTILMPYTGSGIIGKDDKIVPIYNAMPEI